MTLRLYKISQEVNYGYDTYDNAVVCAESAEDAVTIHPNGRCDYDVETWCKKEDVEVENLGVAKVGVARGVVCASFNAG